MEKLACEQESGIPYTELIDRLIQLAVDRHRIEQGCKTSTLDETRELVKKRCINNHLNYPL